MIVWPGWVFGAFCITTEPATAPAGFLLFHGISWFGEWNFHAPSTFLRVVTVGSFVAGGGRTLMIGRVGAGRTGFMMGRLAMGAGSKEGTAPT